MQPVRQWWRLWAVREWRAGLREPVRRAVVYLLSLQQLFPGRGADGLVIGMKETARNLKVRAQEFKEQYLDDAWPRTRIYIRRNPGKTVLIAAAVGLVLGSFLRRR